MKDAEWILIAHLPDALAKHFSRIAVINRDHELHAAYRQFIEARDAEQE